MTEMTVEELQKEDEQADKDRFAEYLADACKCVRINNDFVMAGRSIERAYKMLWSEQECPWLAFSEEWRRYRTLYNAVLDAIYTASPNPFAPGSPLKRPGKFA